MFSFLAQIGLALTVPSRMTRTTGTSMLFDGLKNPFQDKMAGATTVAVTVAFQCAERGHTSILQQLVRRKN